MKFVDIPVQVQVIAADVLSEKLRCAAKGESSIEFANDVKVAFEGLYAQSATPAAVERAEAAVTELTTAVNLQGEAGVEKTHASISELCEIAASALREIHSGMESRGITLSQNEIARVISVARELAVV